MWHFLVLFVLIAFFVLNPENDTSFKISVFIINPFLITVYHCLTCFPVLSGLEEPVALNLNSVALLNWTLLRSPVLR